MRHLPLLLGLLLFAGCNTYGYDGARRGDRGYKNDRRASERSFPRSARVNDRGREAYRLCHKGNKTKIVRTNAVRGHLRHGDTFGSCRRDRRIDARRGNRRARHDDRRGRRHDRRDRRHDDDDD